MKKRRGEITKVSDLFAKYKTLLQAPQESVITEMVVIIHELTNITLQPKQVAYTVATRTLSIHAPSLIRQEIKFHEQAILTHAKARLGSKNAPQVIL